MTYAPALVRRGYKLGGGAARGRAVWSTAAACLVGTIVLAAVIPTPGRFHGDTKEDIARQTVFKFALEAFPDWQRARPPHACPASLEPLLATMNNKDTLDPWGRDYRSYCEISSTGAVSLVATSAGPDREHGTSDDIRSDR
jgi:hypothetical protein